MNVIETSLSGLLIVEPKLFGDARGSFFDRFNQLLFNFVQDNHSHSTRAVRHGLHYQI